MLNWAFFCGLYNGLISVVESVPQILKLAISPLSQKGRDNAGEFISNFKELVIVEEGGNKGIICGKEDYWCKGWNIVKTGISKEFESQAKGSYFIGTVAGPIIVACIGDEVALGGVFGRVGGSVVEFLQWCDRLSDPFRYLGLSVKLVKNASGEFITVIKNATGDIATSVGNRLFKVKVVLENSSIDFRILKQEELELVIVNAQKGLPTQIGAEKMILADVRVGTATSEDICRKIFRTFSKTTEELLEKFSKYGVDHDRLFKLLSKFPANETEIGQKLIAIFEGVQFEDIYKLRNFIDKFTGDGDDLFRNILSKWDVEELVKIGKFDNSTLTAFKKDLSSMTPDLVESFAVNKNLLKSWEILKDAGRRDLKVKREVLEKVSDLINNKSVQNVFGEKLSDGIVDICHAYNGFNGIKSLDQHLDDVMAFLTKFEGFKGKGLDEIVIAMRNANPNVQDGLQHLLTYAKKLKATDVKRFEGNISAMADITEDAICEGCLFDILLTTETKVELKSYQLESLKKAINSATSLNKDKSVFYKQFKQYFQTGNFKYVFNREKISDVNEIKKEFMRLFKENASELWEINPVYFDNLSFKNGSKVTKENFKKYIIEEVDLKSPIFKFIVL